MALIFSIYLSSVVRLTKSQPDSAMSRREEYVEIGAYRIRHFVAEFIAVHH
jgi:hypothetical protein